MPKTIVTETPTKDVRRYLQHWTDRSRVAEALGEQHGAIPADRRKIKARQAALFVEQGIEYLSSADDSSLLTKPLPLFYAAENLVKAVCIIADETLVSSNFRAHGLSGDKRKRNSIKNFCCKAERPGSDVWSRVVTHANADWIKASVRCDGVGLVGDYAVSYSTPQSGELMLGELLRHLPELAEDVNHAKWGSPYVARIENYEWVSTEQPFQTTGFKFRVDHRHDPQTRAMILRRQQDVLKGYECTFDRLNSLDFASSGTGFNVPRLRMDVFGELFIDFGRKEPLIGELATYVAALFILSDVVRYQPDQWKRLLDDHPLERILMDRFLDVAGRKVPNLVLNGLSQETVLLRSAR